jgi:CRISPR-associated protein Cmr6
MNSLQTIAESVLGGAQLSECESRALRLTRYADPTLKDEGRRQYLQGLVNKGSHNKEHLKTWKQWLAALPETQTKVIYGKLESRLLINMAGTVLENAGLQIDRFGSVCLPGSAVKGCARRAALAALHDWCSAGKKPSPAEDNPLAAACAQYDTPEAMLLEVIRVFGCTEQEGQDAASGNDLAWACGPDWRRIRPLILNQLNQLTGSKGADFPNLQGGVAFLQALPHKLATRDIELDVLTCHHPAYYSGKIEEARDTENPIPVYFPAAAEGTTYAFPLTVRKASQGHLLGAAISWLTTGLTVLGLGAKTAAGYGVFQDVSEQERKELEGERKQAREEANERERRRQQEEALAARKREEERLKNLTPEERTWELLKPIAADWGRMRQHLEKLDKLTPEEQKACLRWLCEDGLPRFVEGRKNESKKPWSQLLPAIFKAAKSHKIQLPKAQ